MNVLAKDIDKCCLKKLWFLAGIPLQKLRQNKMFQTFYLVKKHLCLSFYKNTKKRKTFYKKPHKIQYINNFAENLLLRKVKQTFKRFEVMKGYS